MLETLIGGALGLGGKLLGGLFGKSAQDEANAANERMANQNIALQREFAQNGIQWKVADAKAAGISPLYALGAGTTSFSPVSIGAQPADALANSMSGMGQDLGRAIASSASSDTRDKMFSASMQKLQLEGAQLDNDIKRATIASSVQRLKSAQIGPGVPSGGDVPIPTSNPSKINRLYVGGGNIAVDPATSSAKDFEDRYGDDISWMTAPMIGWNDLMHHFGWDGARMTMPGRDYFTWPAWKQRVREKNKWFFSRDNSDNRYYVPF